MTTIDFFSTFLTRECSDCSAPCSARCRRQSCPRISGQAMKKTGRKEDIFNLTWRRWSGRGRRRRNGPSWLNNLVSM